MPEALWGVESIVGCSSERGRGSVCILRRGWLPTGVRLVVEADDALRMEADRRGYGRRLGGMSGRR